MNTMMKTVNRNQEQKEEDDAVTPTQNGTGAPNHNKNSDTTTTTTAMRKATENNTPPTTPPPAMTIQQQLDIFQDEINLLKQRNYEKDRGKDFEGSYTRTIFLMVVTYFTLFLYMFFVLKTDRPALDAIVPTVGFNISTWGLPYVKEWWIQIQHYKRYGEFEKHTKLTPTSHKEFTTRRHQIIEAASKPTTTVSGAAGASGAVPAPTNTNTTLSYDDNNDIEQGEGKSK